MKYFICIYFPFQGTIKELHSRTIKNDVEGFKRKIADPVSPIILCGKDAHGHNVLHKVRSFYIHLIRDVNV